MQLAEQFRPRTWSDVVGQDKAISKLLALGKRGFGGRAYWLTGQSGTGKTSIARLIAAEFCESWSITEIDAGELSADAMRAIERELSYRGMGEKTGKAWVVNEAHGLNVIQVRKLLTLLESLPEWAGFMFTTTNDGHERLFEGCDDAAPLLSRCIQVKLARRDLSKPFAARLREIAQSAGLDGLPIERYEKIVSDCKNNLRMAIQEIESGN